VGVGGFVAYPGGGFKYVFIVHPYFGENDLILTNIFQLG